MEVKTRVRVEWALNNGGRELSCFVDIGV
jgi:hypothetical protein